LSVTIDSVLVQDNEPTAADLDGGVVVLSMRAGSYFGFNQVATEIWNMLAEPCRVGQIFDSLLERHDVDAETLAYDVTPFLQTLVEHRLVRVIDPGEVT
jgi:Coenzyme PQQ synthesis protein D (PqqD)